MIEIGKVNDLVVGRETDSGYYLREPESAENEFEDEDEVSCRPPWPLFESESIRRSGPSFISTLNPE